MAKKIGHFVIQVFYEMSFSMDKKYYFFIPLRESYVRIPASPACCIPAGNIRPRTDTSHRAVLSRTAHTVSSFRLHWTLWKAVLLFVPVQ